MDPVISLWKIGRRFGAVEALRDVSFDILPGECHAIMGENGAGKSTLMKILAGVIPEFDGELYVKGRPVRFTGTRDAEAAGISIIHQELNLVEQLSVSANIFLGREPTLFAGILNQREMDRRAEEILSELECSIGAQTLVGTLRIGDQQLVEIARALSLRSEILIMDEPTSALTESEVERLYRVLARLRARGVTILYISHKMSEVFHLADRITILRDGRFVRTLLKAETSPQETAHLMVGRELTSREGRSRAEVGGGQPEEVVLDVRGLSLPWKRQPGRFRLRDISFQLHRGEILGIAGLMGAGRTELLECLFGASPQRPQGEILLNGTPQAFRNPAQAMRAGMALVTEDRKRLGLFQQLSVRENITVSALSDLAMAGVVRSSLERDRVARELKVLSVKTAGMDAGILTLSGGNQQKCVVARCLLTNPRVLLLDDPTRGVDVGAKAELYQLMEQLAAQGISMIVTSSELPELLAVSDRILVLCEGRLTGEFAVQDATEEKIMEAATSVSTLVTS